MAVDLLIVLTTAGILLVIVTGGGAFRVGGIPVSLRSVDNPVWVLAGLFVLRYAIRTWGPLLAVSRWPVASIDEGAKMWLQTTAGKARALDRSTGRTALVVIAGAALTVKIAFAIASPGFFSGDDVEIHEMTLSHLLRQAWPVWDLRSPVFPFAIVYPAQYVAFRWFRLTEIQHLVVAGRIAVAVLSTFSLLLVWQIGRRMWPQAPGYAVLAAVLLATNKLQMAFGSSELPRPVSTVLVLASFALLLREPPRKAGSVAAAGVLLGVASTFRFSEAVFVLPAAIQLALSRRWRDVAVLVLTAIATAMAMLWAGDLLYWGQPLHSVVAAIDYTLVQRLSSRGYQAPWWYIAHAASWINLAVLVLAVVGSRRELRRTALWLFVPALALSVLPHKEARYLIPVVPFACLLAVQGIAELAREPASRRAHRMLLATAAGLFVFLLHDVGHWKLPRTDADVRLATRLAHERAPALAIDQAWRLGGHLYLSQAPVVDLDPSLMSQEEYLWDRVPNGAWIVFDIRHDGRGSVRDSLVRHGYRERGELSDASTYRVWVPGR